MWKTISAKK